MSMEQILEKILVKVESIENSLDSIDENLIRHLSKNDFMEETFNAQFAKIDSTLNTISLHLISNSEKLTDLQSHTTENTTRITQNINELDCRIDVIESDIGLIKKVLI
ncbi:MAG TPA: hypothetical protein VNQ57_06460 [Ureibacillus sp.]|nr:hypothetical protein [Ureibacillus sp.]